jgi:hypothetical protein
MCTCICEAAENGGNHLQVFDYNNKIVHFGNFSWYYGKITENFRRMSSFLLYRS